MSPEPVALNTTTEILAMERSRAQADLLFGGSILVYGILLRVGD